jgi:arylsulfatase A-like enzyme
MKALTGFTGCDAIRSGYGGEVGDRMNPNLRTIAQTFKAAGYQTGVFGKWHNGKPGSGDPWAVTPMKAGFDSFAGFYGGGTDFFNQMPKGRTPRNWHENDRQSDAQTGYTTDLISENAVRFIEQHAGKPFFCMVTHAAPHEPFQATGALLERVPERIRGDIALTEKIVRARTAEFARSGRMNEKTWEYGGFTEAERRVVYSAMMIGLDDSVGSILDALKKTGQDQNTIVLLFSDNGAMRFIREGNLPLRAWKHSMYEGAIRVPGFLSFPGGGVRVGTGYESMIRGMDLYPTLAALAGVPIAAPEALDGVNHLPAILGKTKAPEVEWNGIFVYYGGYRDNQWKLIAKAGGSELYDMKIESMRKGQAAYLSPLRGGPIFGGAMGSGVDASGARISSTGNLPGPMNEWKRNVLGLGNPAALRLGDLQLVMESEVTGEIRVPFDNIGILKPDGKLIPVWSEGKAGEKPCRLEKTEDE